MPKEGRTERRAQGPPHSSSSSTGQLSHCNIGRCAFCFQFWLTCRSLPPTLPLKEQRDVRSNGTIHRSDVRCVSQLTFRISCECLRWSTSWWLNCTDNTSGGKCRVWLCFVSHQDVRQELNSPMLQSNPTHEQYCLPNSWEGFQNDTACTDNHACTKRPCKSLLDHFDRILCHSWSTSEVIRAPVLCTMLAGSTRMMNGHACSRRVKSHQHDQIHWTPQSHNDSLLCQKGLKTINVVNQNLAMWSQVITI